MHTEYHLSLHIRTKFACYDDEVVDDDTPIPVLVGTTSALHLPSAVHFKAYTSPAITYYYDAWWYWCCIVVDQGGLMRSSSSASPLGR